MTTPISKQTVQKDAFNRGEHSVILKEDRPLPIDRSADARNTAGFPATGARRPALERIDHGRPAESGSFARTIRRSRLPGSCPTVLQWHPLSATDTAAGHTRRRAPAWLYRFHAEWIVGLADRRPAFRRRAHAHRQVHCAR